MALDSVPNTGDPPPQTAAHPRLGALQALVTESYGDLREIARRMLSAEGRRGLVDPTELANDSALRLLKLNRISVEDKAHFLALAARVVRQTMIDEIRRVSAEKRRAPDATLWPDKGSPVDIEALHAAIKSLEQVSPEHARLVDMRFFAGLPLEEIAVLEGASLSTMKRRWTAARAWLLDALKAP